MNQTREDFKQAEEFLLEFLRKQDHPVTIKRILTESNTEEGRRAIASADIRAVIWSLVEKGLAEFTAGRKLKSKQEA